MPLDPHTVLNTVFFLCVVAYFYGVLVYRKSSPLAENTLSESSEPTLGPLNLAGVGILILFFAVTMLAQQLAPVSSTASDPEALAKQITPELLIFSMLGQAFPGLIVLAILVSQRIPLSSFFGLRMARAYRLLYIAPSVVLLTYLFMIILGAIGYEQWLVQLFGKEIEIQNAVRIYQEADIVMIRVLLAVSVVVVAPIVEEIVFRGYIYQVAKRFTARVFSTVISAVFFAVVHNFIPGLVPLAFLAILLTISYEFTGSLWAPISIHALFNASTLLVQEIQHHHQP